VEIWDIGRIQPYEKNAKVHAPEQVAALARSIKKFGWTQPIVVDADGVIIAGHGRRLAALELGMTKVPVVCRTDLTKPEADALRLADNRTASTVYDTELLKDALQELKNLDFDLADTGFDEHELEFMLADLTMIDDAVLVDDIGEAVEEQREKTEDKIREVDETELPIGEGFGFKKLRAQEIRRVKAFMAQIESSTGKEGAAALMAHLDSLGIA
jgi:ParB-like chromosome segregation protein Spo0J